MNNLLSYCWLVDSRISASDKDLPVKELKSMSKLKHVCIPPWNYYEELKVLYPFIDFSEKRFQIAMPYSNNEPETKSKLWDICAKQSDLF